MRAAARRGTIIHQLLERLPELPAEQRTAAAEHWLDQTARIGDASERAAIAGQVLAILNDPRFAELFGPDSLAEAPLAATLSDGRVVAGTVDRLLVSDGEVSVIDFKTGRVPASNADIPPSHLAQMRAYAEALGVIFPGRRVRAALLYTNAPQLFEVAA
jgi:ATP-dependent helicase/nuclease subunit A